MGENLEKNRGELGMSDIAIAHLYIVYIHTLQCFIVYCVQSRIFEKKKLQKNYSGMGWIESGAAQQTQMIFFSNRRSRKKFEL